MELSNQSANHRVDHPDRHRDVAAPAAELIGSSAAAVQIPAVGAGNTQQWPGRQYQAASAATANSRRDNSTIISIRTKQRSQ